MYITKNESELRQNRMLQMISMKINNKKNLQINPIKDDSDSHW